VRSLTVVDDAALAGILDLSSRRLSDVRPGFDFDCRLPASAVTTGDDWQECVLYRGERSWGGGGFVCRASLGYGRAPDSRAKLYRRRLRT